MDSFAGNDHQQYALGFEPRIGVAEKQLFHALVGAGPHLEIVGRVEVEEGKSFDPGTHVEDVALDGLDAALFGADCTVGVEFLRHRAWCSNHFVRAWSAAPVPQHGSSAEVGASGKASRACNMGPCSTGRG